MPAWIHTLNNCLLVIEAKGHVERLQWRSEVKALMQQAVAEMAEDEESSVFESKLSLTKMIRAVNVPSAQQMIKCSLPPPIFFIYFVLLAAAS